MGIDSEALFTANQHRLFRYFRRAVGQAETARDLTQDVFVRISRVPVPVAPEGHLRAGLFRIARNLAIDHHRGRLREPHADESLVEASRPASQDVDLAVNEALAALPDLDRDVFLMREIAGLGYDEIASARCGAGIPTGAGRLFGMPVVRVRCDVSSWPNSVRTESCICLQPRLLSHGVNRQ